MKKRVWIREKRAEKGKKRWKDIVLTRELHYNGKQTCNMRREKQMQKRNYQKELDHKIEQIVSEQKIPRLFLHSCCAPCSSYVLEYLSQYFEITVFFYNPNISLEEEYRKRVAEIHRLVSEMPFTTIRIFFRRLNLKRESTNRKS